MKPSRKAALPVVLLSASMLVGCTIPLKPPPQISYDDDAQPAVQLADPPKPVEIVEMPKLLPLPGQLKPLHGAKSKPESGDPRKRVEKANAAARVQPTRNGYIDAVQVYPFSQGALYQVYAAPGQVTDVALQERGEYIATDILFFANCVTSSASVMSGCSATSCRTIVSCAAKVNSL